MIEISNLEKSFPARTKGGAPVTVLDDVNFSIADHEFYVLLGASGCGKTTTLRSVAGLERPDLGTITIDGKPVFSAAQGLCVDPEDRPIAMVFQSYGLWPHMNVRENIMLPLYAGNRRVHRAEAERRLERVLEMLRLAELVERPISMLSGGQQQRVALARALALEPAVLLMDEPLSNLDAKLRTRLRVELKELVRAIGITTIYVTHDQAEAMIMGDRIAVMSGGRILQEGGGEELYQAPRSLEVAKFLGDMNFLSGRVVGMEGQVVRVQTEGGYFLCRPAGVLAMGQMVEVGFRPEDATIAAQPGEGVVTGEVTARYYLGDAFTYEIEALGGTVTARLSKADDQAQRTQAQISLAFHSCIAFATSG